MSQQKSGAGDDDGSIESTYTLFVGTLTIVLVISLTIYIELKSLSSKSTRMHWKRAVSDDYNARKFSSLDTWLSQYPHIEPHRAYQHMTCNVWKCNSTYIVTSQQWSEPRQEFVLHGNTDAYNRWQSLHQSQNNQLLDTKQRCDWIFIGDSITFGWIRNGTIFNQYFNKQNNAVIYAQAGDRINEIGWRLADKQGNGFKNMEQCLLRAKAKRKSIVLLIGTNDLGSGSTFEVALTDYMVLLTQLSAFMTEINKKQYVVLYLMAIFPRGANWVPKKTPPYFEAWNEDNPHFYGIHFMNGYLQSFARNNDKYIKYINCNHLLFDNKNSTNTVIFKDNKGALHEYTPGVISTDILRDLLHLSDKGYKLWAKCILTQGEM